METLYFLTRILAAPLGLVFLHCKSLLCSRRKDVNYIRRFYQTGHAWDIFCKICEAHVLNRAFECWHKSRIQFVHHSAINSAKWIFFKIQKKKKKKLKKLLAWKGFHNEAGDIRMNARPLANEGVSIYNLNWWDWKQINAGWHTWTSVTCLPQL